MATLTQEQQSNFARVFLALTIVVGDNENDAPLCAECSKRLGK